MSRPTKSAVPALQRADRAAQRAAGPAVASAPTAHDAHGPMWQGPGNLVLQHATGQNELSAVGSLSQPGDAGEALADRMAARALGANGASRKTSALPLRSPSAMAAVSAGVSGQPLGAAVRAFFEPRFGHDFRDVRIHQDEAAARAARAFDAHAYTAGSDIVFGSGRYAPDTAAGQRLLAHELAHVVQQAHTSPGALPAVQRQPASTAATAPPSAAADVGTPAAVPLVPPAWVREPGGDDILAVVYQGRMVALPAAGSMVRLQAPKAGIEPTAALFTVPTVGKEGMLAVNVGGRIGFQIDAGGEPLVVYPAALAAIRQALGVETLGKAVVTHIHDDHVRAFVATVQRNGIRPEGLFYPAAFAVNANAPGSTFAKALQAVQADPALRGLGHGAGGAYQAIPTPAGGAFFRNTVQEGEVTFDFYGLTRAFQDLQNQRSAGQKQPGADTASLLTRVTFAQRPGAGMLYLGDLRGSDLTRFEQAMGPQAYQEMLRGVRVITGFQHHMGALESQADRQGLMRLLSATYAQSGELDVVVQSADTKGNFSLNQSLVSSLTGMGVTVHVAKDPRAGEVGTITYDSQGNIRIAGGGEVETHAGSAEMQAHVRRLAQLEQAVEVLTRYGRFVNPSFRYTEEAVSARDALKAAVEAFIQTSLGNVRQGAAGRAQSSLANPAQQEQALQRVRARYAVEDKLLPAYMESLRELQRQGPHREVLEREFAAARTSGRLSEAGIEALWEVEPEVARRLVGESGMSRPAQRQTMAQLPGQPMPMRGRVMAGFMIVVTLVQEIAPVVKAAQDASYAEDVRKALLDIIWWQDKGVFPTMQGVNDRWWPRENEWTTSPARIQALLDSNDLDYLALTGIPDSAWDAFMIWASSHLQSYPDWNAFIQRSTAIQSEGPNIQELKWSYRRGKVQGTRLGIEVTEEWQYSDRLTTILRAAAQHVVDTTEQQIADVAKAPGAYDGPAYRDPQKFVSTPAYAGAPKATGRKQFKPDVTPVLYTLVDQHKRRNFDHNAVFYVFPESQASEPVPAGYVVVGGADYNTYISIYNSPNRITFLETDQYGITRRYAQTTYPNQREVLLAEVGDLRDASP